MTSQCRLRGEATFAMNRAIGKAITASTMVTAAATPTLRSATARYTGSVRMVWKLANVGTRTSSPVKLLTVHSDETSSTASEPR